MVLGQGVASHCKHLNWTDRTHWVTYNLGQQKTSACFMPEVPPMRSWCKHVEVKGLAYVNKTNELDINTTSSEVTHSFNSVLDEVRSYFHRQETVFFFFFCLVLHCLCLSEWCGINGHSDLQHIHAYSLVTNFLRSIGHGWLVLPQWPLSVIGR